MSLFSIVKASSTIIIFDVEGTLVDCVAQTLESWQAALNDFGHAFSRDRLQPYSGMDGEEMLDRLLPGMNDDKKKEILNRQGELYEQQHLRTVRSFPPVHDLFQTLKKRGFTLAIGTTCKHGQLAVYDKDMRVLEYTEAIACGDEVKRGKPHPDLFRCVLKKLGADQATTVIAVGDTPYDAKAATALHLQAVGVLTGGFSEDALRSAGCDRVLREVADFASQQFLRNDRSSDN
jgi:HAD superfamily hydrolase (TIGR01549 family)